jgi:hypothetical protein
MKDDLANSAFAGSVLDDSDMDIDDALAKIANGTKSAISKSNRPSKLNLGDEDEDFDGDHSQDTRTVSDLRG